MKRLLVVVAIAMALDGAHIGAQQSRAAIEKRFASAEHKASIEGDLKGAIDEYKAIVAAAGSDRSAAARALLRMAEAYQKLGDTEAQQIYQRIVKQYPEQREAASVAQTRLGSTAQGAVARRNTGDRPVWTGPDVDMTGTVSPDGRYLTYVDWGTENVMLRDLVANTSRALTDNRKTENGYPTRSVISRDGTQAVFAWTPQGKAPELRLANLKDAGSANRVVATFSDKYPSPSDWSPDQRFIATVMTNGDQSLSLGLVAVQDGTFRQVKSLGWGLSGRLAFSPDGRHLAYDFTTADHPNRRDVMVISVDANQPVGEEAVVADGRRNHLMGWSATGDIIYSSDRSGSSSLWTVRFRDGRAISEPRLAKENVVGLPLGLTSSGSLYVWRPASATYVQAAPLDSNSNASTMDFQQFIDSRGSPRWSADGRHLVFVSCGLAGGGPCSLFIRDVRSGQIREIPHTLGYVNSPSVAPDGQTVVASGEDLKGRHGIHLIDAATGRTILLVQGMLTNRYPEWSADGQSIFYRHNRGDDHVLMEHIVAAGRAQEVFRPQGSDMSWIRVSPDRKMVGFIRHPTGDSPKPSTFVVAPLSGGQERALFSSTGLNGQIWQWATDSQSVVLQKEGSGGSELWRVPLTGTPHKLAVDASSWSSFHLSPDSKHVAFTAQAGTPGAQIWALENFLPPAKN